MAKWTTPLYDLAEYHGYKMLEGREFARIERDYPNVDISLTEDFAAFWKSKRKRKPFNMYSRLRNWLRISQDGHRRFKQAAQMSPDTYDADDIMQRYGP